MAGGTRLPAVRKSRQGAWLRPARQSYSGGTGRPAQQATLRAPAQRAASGMSTGARGHAWERTRRSDCGGAPTPLGSSHCVHCSEPGGRPPGRACWLALRNSARTCGPACVCQAPPNRFAPAVNCDRKRTDLSQVCPSDRAREAYRDACLDLPGHPAAVRRDAAAGAVVQPLPQQRFATGGGHVQVAAAAPQQQGRGRRPAGRKVAHELHACSAASAGQRGADPSSSSAGSVSRQAAVIASCVPGTVTSVRWACRRGPSAGSSERMA